MEAKVSAVLKHKGDRVCGELLILGKITNSPHHDRPMRGSFHADLVSSLIQPSG